MRNKYSHNDELTGAGTLTAEEAQGFTPLATDESLDNQPPIDYPVEMRDSSY
jgi:hypothetical protein